MEERPALAAQLSSAEQINKHEVDVLWDLDWEEITAGFKAECLRKIVTLIRNVRDRIAAVRACLCHYRYYLIGLDHDYYVNCWDSGCPFKELCEQIIWDLEEICTYTIDTGSAAGGENEHDAVNAIFQTEQAQELMARLCPAYYRNGHWVKEVKKVFICQVAHVLSGLLEIPDCRKWTYFEQYWKVTGLSKAFNARYGRPLDPEIRALFPEYKGQ